jgi:hypothetical protein
LKFILKVRESEQDGKGEDLPMILFLESENLEHLLKQQTAFPRNKEAR